MNLNGQVTMTEVFPDMYPAESPCHCGERSGTGRNLIALSRGAGVAIDGDGNAASAFFSAKGCIPFQTWSTHAIEACDVVGTARLVTYVYSYDADCNLRKDVHRGDCMSAKDADDLKREMIRGGIW